MQKLDLKGDFMAETGAKKEKDAAEEQPIKGLRKLSVVSLMFFLISFLGWCMEMIYCSSWFTDFNDRGFLTLPFCVIYGTPLCLVFLLLGSPKEGFLAGSIEKTSLKKGVKIFLCYALYFLLSAGIATLFELVFGLLFDSFGVRLWSYRRFPLNYKGYVCLYFSLLWGTLITLSMSTFFNPLYRTLARIPHSAAMIINLVLWVAVIADFSFNIVYLLREGHHFELIFFLWSGFL